MKRFPLPLAIVACTCLGSTPPANATPAWMPPTTITRIEQTSDYEVALVLSPELTTLQTGCSSPSAVFVPKTGGAAYTPSYKSIAPLITGAFLYNKPVEVLLDGCTQWGRPIVTGIKVIQ